MEMIKNDYLTSENDIRVLGHSENFTTELNTVFCEKEVTVLDVNINALKAEVPQPITLQWKIPAHNIKGVWKPTTDFSKRIQADWELDPMESRISIDAPVICLFGHDDTNRHTFACSEVIEKLELNAVIREEDDCIYCYITLFQECTATLSHYNVQIRIDTAEKHFSEAIKEVSKWWETDPNLQPATVPDIAINPLYSTWYQFHQHLEEDDLIKECKRAFYLGYKTIIIDDGWQTNNGNRGYDYTGDWKPERLSGTKEFVDKVHAIGMKIGFWYSVPFCGKRSKAYQRFKGKFLTENHRWAPVFDPRYPEVRDYLINIYRSALVDWNLDGFKLDFIDDFKHYPDTPVEKNSEMDFHSINEAVNRLLTDVMQTLYEIRPDIFIEFRQKYTGPAMRKYGNMFRAFDCPGDVTMNRVRIADIRMLAGNTAVHSDMVTWHKEEALEVAALHMVNTLFGVPQISVMLKGIPETHLEMVKFYTNYWNQNRELITGGHFIPLKPLANYPVQQVSDQEHIIIGVYDDHIIQIDKEFSHIDIINGKLSRTVIIKISINIGTFRSTIFNCKGDRIHENDLTLDTGILEIEVPACGLIKLTLKT